MDCLCKIVIIFSFITSILSADCPCNTVGVCDCSSMNFETFPHNLPEDVQVLNLSSNRIQIVTENDLQTYEKLKILLLQHNSIHTIQDNSFDSLKSLGELDLSFNKLALLKSAWFKNLSMLKYLRLQDNLYSSLGTTPLFAFLPSLKWLEIGGAYYFVIEKQNFYGLESLSTINIKGPNLKQYETGSLKLIKSIDHIILNVNTTVLPDIVGDLVSNVELLEIYKTSLADPDDVSAFSLLDNTSVKKIKFKNSLVTDSSTAKLIELFDLYNNVTEFIMEDCELKGTGQGHPFLKRKNSSVTTAVINYLYIPNFFLFSDLHFMYNFVHHFKSITCTNSKVFLIPCQFSKSFSSLVYLDLTGNLLADYFLASSACYPQSKDAWPLLQTLNVSKNLLKLLPYVAEMFYDHPHLTNLDISQNNFGDLAISLCKWSLKLKYLNISSCQIKNIHRCIPHALEVLDISNNYLTEFMADLPFLRELDISNNRLVKLPGDAHLPSLVNLFISRNKLNDFYKSDLKVYSNLTNLDGRENNYVCSCNFLPFIQTQNMVTLIGWPDNYTCDSPSSLRGRLIEDATLSVLACHKALIVALACIILIVIFALLVALCHFLHVMWYVKMTWAWLKAKKKPLLVSDREIVYDAFISYSERDSEWVQNMMVQELENTTPSLKLCLHKRDFVPGKWIIDNIIDAMDKSYKTLFVLSEHFVQSEWCKYELEFSHFRLFDENNDTAILILLEPIEKETIPKRFCKLRKLMNTRTYMEWPSDEEEQQIFWLNLKTVLQDNVDANTC
ncbi:toll-like receptor 2 [Bombina bombina]|uniref:toll-like receptor 2 n=1 Tax=Bombina bombina TaxID=8345 RepID=UPI00235A745B|nr:toll-like receptor 2 [Bombina bombina]